MNKTSNVKALKAEAFQAMSELHPLIPTVTSPHADMGRIFDLTSELERIAGELKQADEFDAVVFIRGFLNKALGL